MSTNNNEKVWDVVCLGDYAEFKNGINFSAEQKGKTGILTIDVLNMYGAGHTVSMDKLYRVNKNVGESHKLKKDDILFVRSSLKEEGVGWATLFDGFEEDVTFCGFIIRCRLRNEEFNPSYLTYYFRSDEMRRQLISGSGKVAVTNINQHLLSNLLVPKPHNDEQDQIVYVLSTLEKAIQKQKEIINTTTVLKKSLLNKLFTEGTKGEPLKQTETGMIPESWEVEKLGNIVNFTTGKLNSNAAVKNGKYPFFTCSQETFEIDTFAFDQEALLLSGNNASAIYSVKYYSGKFNAYQRTYVITIKNLEEYCYNYMKHLLSFKLEELRNISIGSSTKYLTLGLLTNLQMPKPKFDEQMQIGVTLDAIDKKLSFHQRKKHVYDKLFKSLLNELMTGYIRVHDIDFNSALPSISKGEISYKTATA